MSTLPRSILSLLFIAFMVLPMEAQEGAWKVNRFDLFAQDRDLAQVLNEFSDIQKIGLTLDDQIKGTVSGEFKNVEPLEFLNGLAQANHFVWFFDGTRVFIDPEESYKSEVEKVEFTTEENVNEAIEAIGFASGPEAFTIRVSGGKGVLSLVGPPPFHRATKALIRDLEQQERARRDAKIVVRVYKLNYASAEDLQIRGVTETSVIPGVARILQNLMAEGSSAPLSTGTKLIPQLNSQVGVRASAISGRATPAQAMLAADALGAGIPTPPASDSDSPPESTSQTIIQTDPRTNSVIVRDVAARVPIYDELIKLIDIPTRVVEISVTIVDIDANSGIDFGLQLFGTIDGPGDGVIAFGSDAREDEENQNNSNRNRNNNLLDSLQFVGGGGFNASALIIDGATKLLARVKLMEEKGAVRIISSPAVITIDNMPATFRQDETVYVRVAGREEVDLFDVTAGVQMTVTPTVYQQKGKLDFRLMLDITDGTFLEQQVDQIPATRESVISTQAVVPNGKSLLIGGYYVERSVDNTSQVPYMGDVPVLGYLFKQKQKSKDRSQRFFFITPRVVDVNAESQSIYQGAGKGGERNPLPIQYEETQKAKALLEAPFPESYFIEPEKKASRAPVGLPPKSNRARKKYVRY